MKRFLALILCSVMSVSAIRANEKQAQAEILSTATIFSLGGMGYAGTASEPELAFFSICARPDAVPVLRSLYKQATLAGRAYVLTGLKRLSPDDYTVLSKTMLFESRSITVQHGCVQMELSSMDVLAQIEDKETFGQVLQKLKPTQAVVAGSPGT